MNKKAKNIIISFAMIGGSIVIAGGILLSIIEPSKEERERNNVTVEWDKAKDDPSKTLNISWQPIPVSVSARGDSWMEKNLEEKFNIKFDTVFFDWNAFKNKRPLIFASGSVPDVIWDGDPNFVRNNADNNFIMEIPYEVILKYAPNYVKLLNKYGREAWLYSEYNGKNYGLPTFIDSAIGPRLGSWRKDWLENVGITKTPDTLEEMEEALRRFRHNDPDKNGKKDTYGWSPAIGHWSLAYSEVFSAFDILPFDFMVRDNKVVWGGVQPEAKEALAVLRRWYADELLDPDFIVDSQQPNTSLKFINGKVGYAYPVDSWYEYDTSEEGTTASLLKELTDGGTMTPAKPLIGKDGKRRGRSWGGAAHVIQFGKQLSREPEKIIRVLKMFDEISKNEKLYVETKSGKEGEHWNNIPGEGIKISDKYRDTSEASRQMIGIRGFSNPTFFPSVMTELFDSKYTRKEVTEFENKYKKKEWSIQNAIGISDVLKSGSLYFENLNILQQQYYAKIIIGELPLSAFDDFVKEYYARGGKELLEEANQYYEKIQQIYKKVGAIK